MSSIFQSIWRQSSRCARSQALAAGRPIIQITLRVSPPERPCTSYDEARARFDELRRQDSAAIDPSSRSRLISPGHRTERVIVVLLGLSNSPLQFLSLADRFSARGYTILMPRLPYHGYLDRM